MAVHDWASILNTKGQVDAIMLDFSKAFDKVSHTKLIHKLQYHGINGKILLWLSSAFLTNRSQFVSVGEPPLQLHQGILRCLPAREQF